MRLFNIKCTEGLKVICTLVTLVAGVALLNCGEMQHRSADEIASVLIARLMREVQHFVADSLIQEGASADEIWDRFLLHLKGKTSSHDVGGRPKGN